MSSLPLAGVKVLDFTHAAAGPCCAMYLADFGADVVKVEPPTGDHSRRWGQARYGNGDEFSALFLSVNRNKRSAVVNLKSEGGRAVAKRLAEQADVVLESFTPGVAARLGIGYDELSHVRPEIIYCSVSAFGQTGPLAEMRGTDQMLQAYAGPGSITGEPGGGPVRFGPSAIDMLTGAHAAIGVLVAYIERQHSGHGQYIDTSLYDAALHLMTYIMADSTGTGRIPGKFGAHFPFRAPYGLFRGSDRDFFLGMSSERGWQKFCVETGLERLLREPKFVDNRTRVENSAELYHILIPIFEARPAAEWVELAGRVETPASLVHDLGEVVQQKQAIVRDMIIDAGAGTARCAGIPIKLGGTPGQVRWLAPSLGSSTAVVLGEVGFGADEIDELEREGAIRSGSVSQPDVVE